MSAQDEIKRLESILDQTRLAGAVAAKQSLRGDEPSEIAANVVASAARLADKTVLEIINQCGRTPACEKGCSFCCHLMVEVTVPEILAIAKYIRDTFTQEEQASVLQAAEASIEATKDLTRKERLNFRFPCPLLKDGASSVYAIRPAPCRSWHSFDVTGCQRDFESPLAHITVDFHRAAVRVGAYVNAGVSIALRYSGLDSRGIELVRGLKIALEDPSLLDAWHSKPKAFDDAVRSRAHPDPDFDRNETKRENELYRQTKNHPQWNSS